MMEMMTELSVLFDKRVALGRIQCSKAKKLISLYMDEIEATNEPKVAKRLVSLMVLRYLIQSGDDMWLEGCYAEFHKAYRAWGVINSSGLCSHDSVMWSLIHDDELISKAFDKFVTWRTDNMQELRKEEADATAKLFSK